MKHKYSNVMSDAFAYLRDFRHVTLSIAYANLHFGKGFYGKQSVLVQEITGREASAQT